MTYTVSSGTLNLTQSHSIPVICCRSHSLTDSVDAAEPMRFQIYEETGLTPATAARTAALTNHAFPLHSTKHVDDNKENHLVTTTAAAVKVVAEEEEPMAVDWVKYTS